MKIFPGHFVFLALMMAGSIAAAPNAEAAFGGEKCTASAPAKFTSLYYIDQFAFEEALPFCDGGAKCSRAMRLWIAVREFSMGNYAAAEKWFAEADTFAANEKLTKGWDRKKGWASLDDIRRYLRQRSELGQIKPEYVQKIRVLYPRQTRATAPFTPKALEYDASVCRLRHIEMNFGMLKQYIELFSRGRLSIAVDYQVVDGAMTRLNKRAQGLIESIEPWNESVANLMADTALNYDLAWFIYPYKGGIAFGGVGGLPLAPDMSRKVGMRRVWYPDGWGRFMNYAQFFHEYLHTLEFTLKLKLTTHGGKETERILKETGLEKEKSGETDYAEWHFAHTIPGKKSWEEAFGYPKRRKNRVPETDVQVDEVPIHKGEE